ncbi:hypothetical protein CDAR_111071 [Caerostris darwini]|uniref:Uncharacterized protein n=1 Tax=Caerostris darwini TaxID=1538125 RepID=A0AAV4SVR6_9ARAC|nr:hypothetical protein CDAR_111071 [Caerostris darwini]
MCLDRSNKALMHLQKARQLQTMLVIAKQLSAYYVLLVPQITIHAHHTIVAFISVVLIFSRARRKMRSSRRNDGFDFSKIRNRVSLIKNKEFEIISNDNA